MSEIGSLRQRLNRAVSVERGRKTALAKATGMSIGGLTKILGGESPSTQFVRTAKRWLGTLPRGHRTLGNSQNPQPDGWPRLRIRLRFAVARIGLKECGRRLRVDGRTVGKWCGRMIPSPRKIPAIKKLVLR